MFIPIISSIGPGVYKEGVKTAIRLVRHGCTNRPFYHICVMESRIPRNGPVIEQIGCFDPMANVYNEKLIAINLERFNFWLGSGSSITHAVSELLGLMGYLPIHPKTYIKAWRNRSYIKANANKYGIPKTKYPPLGCCFGDLNMNDEANRGNEIDCISES